MRQTSLIILVFFIYVACSHENNKPAKRELIPDPEKYAHDVYLTLPDSLKPTFTPDTSIGPISLLNFQHIDSYLGENAMERLTDQGEGFSSASIVSVDSKQRLTFYFHPGSMNKEFSEFQVGFVDQKGKNEFKAEENEFQTEHGIKLGMSMGQLKSIKGEPDSLSQAKKSVLHYRISDLKNSEFLKKYNMPVYYADYEFQNGYLMGFKFGFQYP